jgi:hypothetical protein
MMFGLSWLSMASDSGPSAHAPVSILSSLDGAVNSVSACSVDTMNAAIGAPVAVDAIEVELELDTPCQAVKECMVPNSQPEVLRTAYLTSYSSHPLQSPA